MSFYLFFSEMNTICTHIACYTTHDTWYDVYVFFKKCDIINIKLNNTVFRKQLFE